MAAVYAIAYPGPTLERSARDAVAALRTFADVTVVLPTDAGAQMRDAVRATGAQLRLASGVAFESAWYRDAVRDLSRGKGYDEYILTGDSWFGPIGDLAAVAARLHGTPADYWQMVRRPGAAAQDFPEEGFPGRPRAWFWTAVRRSVVDAAGWDQLWRGGIDDEAEFVDAMAAGGYLQAEAFPLPDAQTDDPALLAAEALVEAGCPLLLRRIFELYPPFLHRHAIIGRDILAAAARRGLDLGPVWESLARTVPPKALNTNAGMLEVILPDAGLRASSLKVVAVAHITRLEEAGELLSRVAHLPAGSDVVVTTTDGIKALRLQRLAEPFLADGRFRTVDVRVTPSGRGRDMSDFFIACRDVLADSRYDLVVKVHARRQRRKTVNVRRYFQRYQVENLLDSPAHVRAILSLFEKERGLGAVFPPMMHIGYATMGGGWGACRAAAIRLSGQLGITVPLDRVSPLAPYGSMWIGRPEAFAVIAGHPFTAKDYRTRRRLLRRSREAGLAKVQERLIAPALAQAGYHCRTVLSAEHAAISHTAAEFKLDELLETTHGHPVDAITLMHRAGPTGHGGALAVTQMYLHLHFPLLARATAPAFALLRHVILVTRAARPLLSVDRTAWRSRR